MLPVAFIYRSAGFFLQKLQNLVLMYPMVHGHNKTFPIFHIPDCMVVSNVGVEVMCMSTWLQLLE